MLDAFVGRSRELRSVEGRLASGARIVTLVGSAGVGKTRLAYEIVTTRPSEFAQRFFCELSTAETLGDAQAAVARTLKVQLAEPSGTDNGWKAIGEALARRGPVLLVLDNVDHIAKDVGALIHAAKDAKDTHFLITASAALGLNGEVCESLDGLGPASSLSLFLTRAESAGVAVAPSTLDHELVIEVLERIGHIPLAIEILAPCLRTLSVAELAERVQQAASPPVTRAIEIAWLLLSPAERHALTQCGVFSGGFTRAAGEGVLRLGEGAVVGEALDRLTSASLIRRRKTRGERFMMLESIRLFADAKSEGGRRDLERRHGAYYGNEGARWARALGGPETDLQARRIDAEASNLVAITRRFAEDGSDLALRAWLVFARWKCMTEKASELDAVVIDRAVTLAASLGDARLEGEALLIRYLSRPGGNSGADLERAGELVVVAGLEALAADVDVLRGRRALDRLDLTEAKIHFDRALDLATEIARPVIASTIAAHYKACGRAKEADAAYDTAVTLARTRSDARAEALACTYWGLLEIETGDLYEARQTLARAVADLERLGERKHLGHALAHLAALDHIEGNVADAQEHYEASLRLLAAVGDVRARASWTTGAAALALETGQFARGGALAADAAALAADVLDRTAEGIAFAVFGVALTRSKKKGDAQEAFSRACTLLATGDLDSPVLTNLFSCFTEGESAVRAGKPQRALLALRDDPRLVPLARQSLVFRFVCRLVDRECSESSPSPPVLEVEANAEWMKLGGDRTSLDRDGAPRRILAALVGRRIASPDAATLTPLELFDVGWPGSRVDSDVAADRVSTAVSTLRKLGLAGVLLKSANGYFLDPRIDVRRASRK